MAAEVAEVANRCREGQSTRQLDLSKCGLKSIPDAVFFFFSETKPETCDFSQNVLKRIPAKIGQKFSQVTVFNMSDNCISELPTSLVAMTALSTIDLSNNQFSIFPDVLYSLSSLEDLNVENNDIKSINVHSLLQSGKLRKLNVKCNPLNGQTHLAIEECKQKVTLEYSEQDPMAQMD